MARDALRHHADAQAFADHPAPSLEIGHLQLDVGRPRQRLPGIRQKLVQRMPGKVAQQVIVQRVFQEQFRAVRQGMPDGDHQPDAIPPERERGYAGHGVIGVVDAKINRGLGHKAWNVVAVALKQIHADIAATRQKPSHHAG
ncbi:hypothetical protein D3C71_1622340 [compost metagenome]